MVISLEVIEHVPDPARFVRVLAALLEPDGQLVLSTLNRTRRSWLTAKFGRRISVADAAGGDA